MEKFKFYQIIRYTVIEIAKYDLGQWFYNKYWIDKVEKSEYFLTIKYIPNVLPLPKFILITYQTMNHLNTHLKVTLNINFHL